MSKIFIVDDDDSIVHQISTLLQNSGHVIFSTLLPESVLEFLYTNDIDLILMDIGMPKINGLNLLKKVKEHPVFQAIPVIMLTSSEAIQLQSDCFEAGAVDFLHKPINKVILRARVQSALKVQDTIDQLHIEISERKRVEAQLRKLSQAVKQSGSAVMITDKRGIIEYVNPSFSFVTGYSFEESVGKNPRFIQSGMHEDEFYSQIWEAITQGKVWKGELANRHKGGNLFWETATISPILNQEGAITHYVAIKEDITKRKLAEEKIKYLANHDELTGLPSLRLANDRIRMAISRAKRTQTKTAVLFLDLDRFKAVNDTYGHAAGNLLLKDVVTRFLSSLRETDTVARIGGDEFLMILSDFDSIADVAGTAQKIVNIVAEPFIIDQQEIKIGVSIGIALYPDHAVGADDLVKLADKAMYKVKDNNKNNFVFYEEGFSKESS